jgi:hypothetical protein
MARLDAVVPEGLKRRFKAKLALEGKKFTEWLLERIEEYLEEKPKPAKGRPIKEG